MRARHAGLKTEVASEVTSVGDATVRCVLAKNEAFFVGEEYVLTVDGAMGVGGGEATFVVSDAAAATGAIEVRITLTARAPTCRQAVRRQGRVEPLEQQAALRVDLAAADLGAPPRPHAALRRPLEGVGHQVAPADAAALVARIELDWSGGKAELLQHLSKHAKLYVGQQYTLRIADSPFATADPLALSTEDWGGRPVPLAVRRIWHKAHVTLHTKQELPIPFGLQMRIKHVGLGVVVARATTGEEEAQRYEAQRDDGVNARRVAHGAGAAAEKLAALWRRGTTSTSTARARRG